MRKIIKHATYPITYFIYAGLTDKEFRKALKKDSEGRAGEKFLDQMCGDDFSAIVHSYKTHIIIRFIDKKPPLDIIVHECHHALSRTMEAIGNKWTDDGEEAYAYLMQELYKMCVDLTRPKK